MLDGAEAGFQGEASPLKGLTNLFVTPRLSSHTHEVRLRASWYLVHRIHEAISPQASVAPLLDESGSAPADPVSSAWHSEADAELANP